MPKVIYRLETVRRRDYVTGTTLVDTCHPTKCGVMRIQRQGCHRHPMSDSDTLLGVRTIQPSTSQSEWWADVHLHFVEWQHRNIRERKIKRETKATQQRQQLLNKLHKRTFVDSFQFLYWNCIIVLTIKLFGANSMKFNYKSGLDKTIFLLCCV